MEASLDRLCREKNVQACETRKRFRAARDADARAKASASAAAPVVVKPEGQRAAELTARARAACNKAETALKTDGSEGGG